MMKRKLIPLCTLLLLLMAMVQSCRKDSLPDFREGSKSGQIEDFGQYDRFGALLEQSISLALEDDYFKFPLIKLTQEKRQGDYEVLLSALLDHQTSNGTKVQDVLLEKAGDLFTEDQLDDFMNQYPSLVIATRGDLENWLDGSYYPPVVFVPSTHKEFSVDEIKGSLKGAPTMVDLSKHHFEEAVIALHLSERHNRSAVAFDYTPEPGKDLFGNSIKRRSPNVNLSGPGVAAMMSCEPEPTTCPDVPPSIADFSVESFNGHFWIDYEVENLLSSYCYWGVVEITRLGPDGVKVIRKFAHDTETAFWDPYPITPNGEYKYTIKTHVWFFEPGPPQPNPEIVCEGLPNGFEFNLEAPEATALVNTFIGTNESNETIFYDWLKPENTPVYEYQLRVKESNQLTPVATLPANQTNYFYNHPESARGSKVDMYIRYRNSVASDWSDDFFDRTFASHRNADEPLQLYGVHVPNPEEYELSGFGEEELYGAPEIRLFAVQGDATGETVQKAKTVIFMEACAKGRKKLDDPTEPGTTISVTTPDNSYFKDKSGPTQILAAWNNALVGTAIKIETYETDNSEINFEQGSTGQTSTRSTKLKGEFGLKATIKIAEISRIIGIESSWETKEESELEFSFPDEDIDFQLDDIYYHEERVLKRGKILYGAEVEGDLCELMTYYFQE